jgi:hypothetical protein
MTILIAVVFTIAVAISAVCGWQACKRSYGLEIVESDYGIIGSDYGPGSEDLTIIERYRPRTSPVSLTIISLEHAGEREMSSIDAHLLDSEISFSFSWDYPVRDSAGKYVSMDIYDSNAWPGGGVHYTAIDKEDDGRYNSHRFGLPQRETGESLVYRDVNGDGKFDEMLDSATNEYYFLVENSWRRVLIPQEDGESTRVLVGDKEVPVVFEDGCWRAAETKDDTEV